LGMAIRCRRLSRINTQYVCLCRVAYNRKKVVKRRQPAPGNIFLPCHFVFRSWPTSACLFTLSHSSFVSILDTPGGPFHCLPSYRYHLFTHTFPSCRPYPAEN